MTRYNPSLDALITLAVAASKGQTKKVSACVRAMVKLPTFAEDVVALDQQNKYQANLAVNAYKQRMLAKSSKQGQVQSQGQGGQTSNDEDIFAELDRDLEAMGMGDGIPPADTSDPNFQVKSMDNDDMTDTMGMGDDDLTMMLESPDDTTGMGDDSLMTMTMPDDEATSHLTDDMYNLPDGKINTPPPANQPAPTANNVDQINTDTHMPNIFANENMSRLANSIKALTAGKQTSNNGGNTPNSRRPVSKTGLARQTAQMAKENATVLD